MDWRNKIKSVVDEIDWIPNWGRDREHDWLDNMGDWMISKKRFWDWPCQFGHLRMEHFMLLDLKKN